MKSRRLFLIACAIIIAALFFAAEFGEGLRFRWRVKQLAGTGAMNCGYVPLKSNPADSLLCVNRAIEKEEAFWVVFDHHGVDSAVASGIASDSAGTTTRLKFDGYPDHGIGKFIYAPRVTEKQCGRLNISASKPAPEYPYWMIEIACE